MKINKLVGTAAAVLTASLVLTACGASDKPKEETEKPSASEGTGKPSDSSFQIAYNADGGHQAWVDAVTNSVKNTLGIEASGAPYPTFAEFRSDITDQKIQTGFRTGWQADYPSLYNFLGPLYGTGAGSNDGRYSSEEFDAAINEGLQAADIDAANAAFDKAQEVLLKDLPAIPLWYANVNGGWSKNVDNVVFGWNSVPLYYAITKADGSVVSANGTEPANGLIPTMTNEVGGGRIMDLIFVGLVSYTADGEIQNEIAESITSDDNTTWTIKIKGDQKFSNGEAITAKSFVDAWNWGANLGNAQLNSYFFENIKGFSWDENVEAMEGLEVVSDTEFKVTLNGPQADFPLSLGYTAFVPLPSVAFDDMAAFGKAPIGNGPYAIVEGSWKKDVSIDLVPNPDYAGPLKAANAGIKFTFYDSYDTAYNDLLSDNLDVIDGIPDSAFTTYEDQLEGRAVNQPAAIFQSFTIPERLDHFGMDEEGKLRRAAISMSIDRELITEKIFAGTRTPAKDFTSPVIAGWSDSLAGVDVLSYNPEEAKKLWEQANEINPW